MSSFAQSLSTLQQSILSHVPTTTTNCARPLINATKATEYAAVVEGLKEGCLGKSTALGEGGRIGEWGDTM
jgi:hypothetical protein